MTYTLLVKSASTAAALRDWHASATTGAGPIASCGRDEGGAGAGRVKREMFNHYHEALLHLGGLGLTLDQRLPARAEQSRALRGESVREVIASSNNISSERFLQDVNHTYVTELVLCLLAIDIVQGSDSGCSMEDHALLSVACGFFARIGILLPRCSLFEEIYQLVELLIYDS